MVAVILLRAAATYDVCVTPGSELLWLGRLGSFARVEVDGGRLRTGWLFFFFYTFEMGWSRPSSVSLTEAHKLRRWC